jgi:uncharacterized delta-60 repeat protein
MFAQNAGMIDASFGDAGKVIIDNGFTDLFTDVEVQDDQKIVAVGISYDASWNALTKVYRFLPDGSPDMTFANEGVFTYSLNNEANVYGCVIKDDGKILMTGSTTDYNDYRILLIQLNSDGTLDNMFGDNGVVVQKIGPDMNFFEDHSYALTLQEDGMILVAGKSYNIDFQFVPVVVRFTENGVLDTTFGTNGVASVPVIDVENDFDCLVIQDDGKIVASGHYATELLQFAMLVARFNADGTLDSNFGEDGMFIQTYGADAEGFGISLTPNNDIVVAGFTASPSYNFDMLLMQLDSDGVLDSNFGDNGFVISDLAQYDVGSALHIQPDGKILVAGSTGEGAPGDLEMAVWRYNADGTQDLSFGTDGIALVQLSEYVDDALCMALQSDGNIIIGGKANNGMNHDFAVVRLLNDLQTATGKLIAQPNQSLSPNPVVSGGSLHINYELTTSCNVMMDIYNATGNLVSLVELGYQNAGLLNTSVSIPSELIQGVYYIRLRGNGFIGEASKLIVTK